MIFTDLFFFIVILIVILVFFYIKQIHFENFDYNQHVNYNTMEQDCNQLTHEQSKCSIKTTIPKNENICNDDFTPKTNNQIEYRNKKNLKKKPTVNLQYDFDLLSSFNNAQINNHDNDIDKELTTDVKSLNSLENDLISNY